jgi:hypothetical protein
MLRLAAGPEGVWPAGTEVNVPDDLAKALLEGGYAEAVATERETAAVEPPEQAVSPKRVIKRRKSGQSIRKTD